MMKLESNFFERDDVVQIARDLIGKSLTTEIQGQRTSGIISETEAYAGVSDKASHAYGGKRTDRTEVMYAKGGTVYVYICYGIHHLFNIVTNVADIPHAVLIRGVIPAEGTEIMEERRGKPASAKGFSSGPGTSSQALGITTSLTGTSLGKDIYVEDRGISVPDAEIYTGPRIGIDYAEEDAKLPYRFLWKK